MKLNMIRQIWERFFPPVHPIPAGIYHYQAPADAAFPYRLHLRVDSGGDAVMIVNASTVVHLNTTAAEYAYHLVRNTPEDQAVDEIARRYNVRKEIVRRDYHDLIERLDALIATPDLDPVAFLDFSREEPYSGALSAPYRIDCALTYRLLDESIRHHAPQERVTRELSREEWQAILDKAWEAGVPHAIFTGGEPTLRPDLCDLVRHAESLGMVTGLITDGLRLAETKYLHELLTSGLDHVMILLDPDEENSWEAVRDTLAEDLALTVHLTLTHQNLPRFEQILERLAKMGVLALSLSADALDLNEELRAKRAQVAEVTGHNEQPMRMVWDLPVPYSNFNPVALELAGDEPLRQVEETGPGQAWLYIEPDGDVLPGQGRFQQRLGNLTVDDWERIWQAARQPA